LSQVFDSDVRLSGEAKAVLQEASDAATSLAQQVELLRKSAADAKSAAARFASPAEAGIPAPIRPRDTTERSRFRESLIDSSADDDSAPLRDESMRTKVARASFQPYRFRGITTAAPQNARNRAGELIPTTIDEQFADEAEAAVHESVTAESQRARSRDNVDDVAGASLIELGALEDATKSIDGVDGNMQGTAAASDSRYATVDDAPLLAATSLADAAVSAAKLEAASAAESAASFAAASRAILQEGLRASDGGATVATESLKPSTSIASGVDPALKNIQSSVAAGAASAATATQALPSLTSAEREARSRQDAAFALLSGQEIRSQLHVR
jgi:hypothetical protein